MEIVINTSAFSGAVMKVPCAEFIIERNEKHYFMLEHFSDRNQKLRKLSCALNYGLVAAQLLSAIIFIRGCGRKSQTLKLHLQNRATSKAGEVRQNVLSIARVSRGEGAGVCYFLILFEVSLIFNGSKTAFLKL